MKNLNYRIKNENIVKESNENVGKEFDKNVGKEISKVSKNLDNKGIENKKND